MLVVIPNTWHRWYYPYHSKCRFDNTSEMIWKSVSGLRSADDVMYHAGTIISCHFKWYLICSLSLDRHWISHEFERLLLISFASATLKDLLEVLFVYLSVMVSWKLSVSRVDKNLEWKVNLEILIHQINFRERHWPKSRGDRTTCLFLLLPLGYR